MQFVQVIILNVQKATELTDKSDGMDTDRECISRMKSRGNRLRYLKLRDSNRRCTSPEGDG